MNIPEIAGFAALALFVWAYAMVNLGLWREHEFRFHLPNFLGALLMIYSLAFAWNLPVFVLESCWGLIALYGMRKAMRASDAMDEKVKKTIRCLLPPILWDGLKRVLRPPPRYYGSQQLDAKLEKYLDFDHGYFVELGANDGVSQSNTLYFEKRRGWRGVLVEPTPQNYLLCRRNRSPETRIFCNACVPFDYAEKFVEIIYGNLMSTPKGLESDVADPLAHAQRAKPFLPPTEDMFSYGAMARPLNDLLEEAGAPKVIDLLSLDVEGAEIAVLKGIDHTRYRFKYLCIECRDKDKLIAYLADHGYRLVAPLSYHDYLFENMR